ncbi:MAG: tetratricopeptide repeat protein, partial [Chthoniobacteraceae bacterium]
SARAMQSLGSVVYELLGGTLSPLASGSDLGSHYTPLANLSEHGNEALRFALTPAPPYKKAGDFLRALAEVDGLPVDIEAPIPVAKSAPRPPPPPRVAPPLPPHSQPGRSGAPLAIAAMLVALILIGGGIYFFVIPLFNKPAVVTQNDEPTLPSDDNPPADPPISDTPKKTEPKPPPQPSQAELLRVASTTAENLENEEKWAPAIAEWIKIMQDFPVSDAGSLRLNMLFEQLRVRGAEFNAQEFPNIRDLTLQAAQLDVVAAMMFLAENVRNRDPKEAFAWYSAAAERGQVSALMLIGSMLWKGIGCERDLDKAVNALRGAVEQGSIPAKNILGEFYLNGINVPQSNEKAFALFKEAADAEDLRGTDWLGTCYHKGIGTKANDAEALRLYTLASDKGFARSLGNLAVLHLMGAGTKVDPSTAVRLVQKGVRARDPFCFYLYARCLEAGNGVKTNTALAKENYIKAAEAGIGEAQKWCKEHDVDFQIPSASALLFGDGQ